MRRPPTTPPVIPTIAPVDKGPREDDVVVGKVITVAVDAELQLEL